MSKKSKKFQGHKRDGKPVVPVITYMAPSEHKRIKTACARLGITQTEFVNRAIARKLSSSAPKKADNKLQPVANGAAESIAT